MILALYDLVIRLYGFSIRLVAPFNAKAKMWWSGRTRIWEQIDETASKLKHPIWVHAASLGEFEQGRPVIEEIKNRNPEIQILLTFFSPSGYEIRKAYPHADFVLYLPLDTAKNARKFIDKIQPRLAIFIKYDFWFNYLNYLSQSEIPFIFISGAFHSRHFLFRPWSARLLEILRKVECFFVQDQTSRDLLAARGIPAETAGDNRIDRVISLQRELKKYPALERINSSKKVLILGSIWPEDLQIIAESIGLIQADYFLIIAPHDISGKMQKTVLSKITGHFTTLSLSSGKESIQDGILVDTIGDLAHLYQYGTMAYIGGGFGRGIHSILEPVASGLPVIFGPNFEKFREAAELIKLNAARSVKNAAEFMETVSYFEDEIHYREAREGIQAFLRRHQGATSKVVDYLATRNYLK